MRPCSRRKRGGDESGRMKGRREKEDDKQETARNLVPTRKGRCGCERTQTRAVSKASTDGDDLRKAAGPQRSSLERGDSRCDLGPGSPCLQLSPESQGWLHVYRMREFAGPGKFLQDQNAAKSSGILPLRPENDGDSDIKARFQNASLLFPEPCALYWHLFFYCSPFLSRGNDAFSYLSPDRAAASGRWVTACGDGLPPLDA